MITFSDVLHSFAGGMNGSIVYELERPENAGLKKSVKACSVSLFFYPSSIAALSVTILKNST